MALQHHASIGHGFGNGTVSDRRGMVILCWMPPASTYQDLLDL